MDYLASGLTEGSEDEDMSERRLGFGDVVDGEDFRQSRKRRSSRIVASSIGREASKPEAIRRQGTRLRPLPPLSTSWI
jgi:hypothetical protein